MTKQSGSSLVELITAMTLLGMVTAVSGLLIQSQGQLARSTAEHAARAETLRSARAILQTELRDLAPMDVRSVGGDSIALRAFRGSAIVCATAGDALVLRYRGLRLPEADKDSMLIVGDERAVAFAESEQFLSCGLREDERLLSITTPANLYIGAVLLFFESGTYHLSGNALRYRRAGEGRQPLTDELINHRTSSLQRTAPGVLRLRLHARDGAVTDAPLTLTNP